MLILAGITLNFVLGENGILEHAKNAGNKYKQSAEEEQEMLDEAYAYMNGEEKKYPENSPETGAGEKVAMPEGWYTYTTPTYEVPEVRLVEKATKLANVYAVSDGQNNTIPIPKDFYYVGGNINTGIVISDNKEDEKKYASSENGDVGKDLKGNQFVWIPCAIENYHKIDWEQDNGKWDRTTR